MKRFDTMRNALLTAVAWTGLLLYILACASWSPDGSTLLYPFDNPETGESGVAIYERGSDRAKVLFASNEEFTPAQWAREGKRAILFLGEQELLLFPLDDSGPLRRFDLRGVDMGDGMSLPIPEVRGNLFFYGDSLTRVDLRSGERFVRERTSKEDIVLFQAKEEVHYARKLEETLEIGTLDWESLALEPDLLLSNRVLEEQGIDEIAFFAVDPRSERIAAITGEDGIAAILLLDRNGLERVVVPRTTETDYVLGNLQWSPDGARVYVSMTSPRDDGESTQVLIAEVALDDGATRVLPIARLNAGWDRDSAVTAFLQPALSPDGNLIAVSTAVFEEDDIAPEDRGLFLIDLRDFGSYVTFIPLPEASGKADREERS